MDAFSEEEWDAQLVLPSLWLGSERAAHCSLETVRDKHGITHILVCGLGLMTRHEVAESGLSYKKIKALDAIIYPIDQHFDDVLPWIHNAITTGGTVLVHW